MDAAERKSGTMQGFGRHLRSLGFAVVIAAVTFGIVSLLPGPVARSTVALPTGASTSTPSGVPSTTTTTAASAPLVTPSPNGTSTIVEIGDSLGIDLGWGLGVELADAPKVHLIQAAVGSTGLSNPWYYDWPSHLATLLAANHPQILVVFLGTNDQQAFFVHGSYCAVGSACWKVEYARRVDAILYLAHTTGTHVLWVGVPVMQSPAFSAGAAMIDGVVRREVDRARWARYLSSDSIFTGPTGHYRMEAIVNHVATAIRAPDGIHINATGENLLAQAIVVELRTVFGIPVHAAQPLVVSP